MYPLLQTLQMHKGHQGLDAQSVVNSSLYASEKRESNTSCGVHGTSETPHLDRQILQPETKAAIQALITALSNISDDKQCTKCAVEASSNILTGHIRDIRAAKKNEQRSKEDKKALKAEIKGFKSPKTNVKALWKDN